MDASTTAQLKAALAPLLGLEPYSVQAVAHLAHVERATAQGNGWSVRRVGVLTFQPDTPPATPQRGPQEAEQAPEGGTTPTTTPAPPSADPLEAQPGSQGGEEGQRTLDNSGAQ